MGGVVEKLLLHVLSHSEIIVSKHETTPLLWIPFPQLTGHLLDQVLVVVAMCSSHICSLVFLEQVYISTGSIVSISHVSNYSCYCCYIRDISCTSPGWWHSNVSCKVWWSVGTAQLGIHTTSQKRYHTDLQSFHVQDTLSRAGELIVCP